MFKYVPNILTSFRFFLVPLFFICYFSGRESAMIEAMVIFIFAGLTDILDGYIARKYNLITPLGTLLDPLADKMMLLSALICLFIDKRIHIVILAIVIAKEMFMIIGSAFIYFRKEKTVVPANKLGKLATVIFTLAVVLLLLKFPTPVTTTTLFIAVSMHIIALIGYITGYKKIN